jgi:hypothetical protein
MIIDKTEPLDVVSIGYDYPFSIGNHKRFPFIQLHANAALASKSHKSPMRVSRRCGFDPSPEPGDFPSYKKNVYYYTYGNAAMIVLNSECRSQGRRLARRLCDGPGTCMA